MPHRLIRYLGAALPALLSVILFGVAVFGFMMPHFERSVLERKRDTTRELAQTVWNILATYHQQVEEGVLPLKEAQRRARERIRSLRYGPDGKDYFWITDLNNKMVMHPYRPDLENQDLSDLKDSEGTRFVAEFTRTAKQDGSGFVTYLWQWKDDPQKVVPKLSFVKGFEPWGWVVGTGIYIEDVQAELATLSRRFMMVGFLVVAMVSALAALIIYRQIKSEHQRDEALEDLRQTKEKYEAVFRSSPDPIVVYNQNGQAEYISPAFTRVFGWSPEELLGKRIDFVPEDQMEGTLRAIKSLYSEESEYTPFESRRLTKSGSVIDVSISAALYRDLAGNPQGMVVNLTDITERKIVEQALKESESKFRSISSNALDAIVMIDSLGRIIFWNKAAESIFGYGESEVLGKDLHLMIAPARYHAGYQNAFQQFQTSGTGDAVGRILELNALNKDHLEFPVEISISPLNIKNQWCAVGIIRDITARKRYEKELKESELRYRALFESVADGIFLMAEEVFIDCNPAALEMLGYTREEIVGLNPFALSPVIQPGGVNSAEKGKRLIKGAVSGVPQNFNWRFTRKSGEEFDTEVSLSGLEIVGGHFLMAMVRDVTDRLRAEKDKARLEAQLQQAQKMEAVGTLASGIAHDFNNILQAISGYIQLMIHQEGRGSEDVDNLSRMDAAAQRASELVRRMLTFSRKVEPELKRIDLNHEVKQAVGILERSLPRMIRIETHPAEDLGVIDGDANQLEQVLLNLGANAGDAMPQGGTLTITTGNRHLGTEEAREHFSLPPGDYVFLEVEDTGEGMTPDVVEHIFDPFYTTKEVGKGTGLGLSMVYGIVKAHHGLVSCDSKPGRGTRFTILFPVRSAGRPVGDLPRITVPAAVEGGTERILLVDDEAVITEVTGEMLRDFGYSVITASSGEEAVELYREKGADLDLVILDLGMPGMGGGKALEKLLAMNQNLKIIISSGYSSDRQVRDSLKAGASEFVAKPYRFTDMLKVIREVLNAKDA